jgi:hypothetical protein
MLYKQHNANVFEGESPSTAQMHSWSRKEVSLWARAAANGLRVIFSATWDVH